jgi:hypothetical protein
MLKLAAVREAGARKSRQKAGDVACPATFCLTHFWRLVYMILAMMAQNARFGFWFWGYFSRWENRAF